MALTLSTISSVFSPSNAGTSGQSFLQSLPGTDAQTESTLAMGKALANALGNAQIKRVQGSSYLAANTAVERIKAQIDAKNKEREAKLKEAIASLDVFTNDKNKVDKTA